MTRFGKGKNMNAQKYLVVPLAVLTLGLSANFVHAQAMDVDQADSLNFQSFHKDKKEAVKAWEKPTETVKTYDEKAAGAKSEQAPGASPVNTSNANPTGKRFELRERYTLTHSVKTPYSAFYVIEPLYKQAAQYCPKGWKKLGERSEPIEQDYYLYFEIECL